MSMSNDIPRGYAIEIYRLDGPEGHYSWTIHKSGKMHEWADRPFTSAEKAYSSAFAAVQRDAQGLSEPPRR